MIFRCDKLVRRATTVPTSYQKPREPISESSLILFFSICEDIPHQFLVCRISILNRPLVSQVSVSVNFDAPHLLTCMQLATVSCSFSTILGLKCEILSKSMPPRKQSKPTQSLPGGSRHGEKTQEGTVKKQIVTEGMQPHYLYSSTL